MANVGEDQDGRRSVGLFRPFPTAGIVLSAVVFKPMTYGHLVSWQAGQYQNANALLLDLTGLNLAQLYGLRRPDDQRVMDAFMEHVHPAIAADIASGVVPIADHSTPPVRQGGPPAAGSASDDPAPGSFAALALAAADKAEARTAEDTARELALTAEADDLDEDQAPRYAGAFGDGETAPL